MDVRPFAPSDRASCLALFTSHHPQDAAGHSALAHFLDYLPGPYFVLEHDSSIVGCGGYVLGPAPLTAATLTWGMIQPALARNGLGRFLLMYRLREIGKHPGIQTVSVTTPAPFAPFYAKEGFRPASTTNTTTGTVELLKKLAVCT